MAFPADILENCSHEELESLSEDYLAYLRCADPDNPEYLSSRDGSEVPISLSTVGYVPLYGGDQTHKVLALFAPEDPLTAVALYLAHQWWTIDDIVRTSNSSREGLQQVRSLGERIVLYVLNRIIYRKKEMERNEVPFLCHSSSDFAKILWRKGEAIGFYSVKPSGSGCSAYLTQSYTLPVLDTMFVRKRFCGKDFVLQMLEDFVDCFTEDALGLRYPLSSLMFSACKQYLDKYPGDQELLWEVEGVGHWFQRTLITSIIKRESQRLLDTEIAKDDQVSQSTEQQSVLPPAESQIGDEKDSETDQKEDTPIVDTNSQVQPDEETSVMIAEDGTTDEHDVTPVSTRTRSSQLKRPKIGKKVAEVVEEKSASPDIPSKKLDSKEQIVENFKELIQQLAEDKDECDMTKLQEEISAKPVEHMFCDTQESQKEEHSENKQVELEPVNGDITKEIFEPQLVDAHEVAREALDTESNLEPGDSDGKSLTTLVSVNMDLEKSFEDSFPDQVLNPDDLETISHENMITEETEIQDEEFKATMAATSTEAGLPCEDPTDNGLPGYTEGNSAEECPTSDETSTMDTGSLKETTVHVTAEALPLLRQGPLLVVELQDVALQHQSDGQRSISGQSEGSVETDQSAQKSTEKGGESSSEEVETETPIAERRGGLRRKARGYKGPPKRRAKLSA
ncbi:soluble lamin-associated protein of 75 kDa [Hyla sarda]|uniref:soluble lamin-associated protein of 75 kDa n=1 Tax=Hyla sarda TaxID=327740 RepID=UPI0024C2A4F1|nr:soluble lamin-associated protein of 75 kDa [Hyla sarda]XP_056396002.1 soluble lamin-associated protein of 75 kDa [Hyla sarda]XP_056396006.1 soluble lamin-associated protein of 75 kDa [Hyla sarda]XP_056396013.1 soluble lamin-associated protein of 75 kDa [Hyla sarda]